MIANVERNILYDELELDLLGDRKTALFVIISDTDDVYDGRLPSQTGSTADSK